MSEINSPLGRRNFANQSKVLTVPDESEHAHSGPLAGIPAEFLNTNTQAEVDRNALIAQRKAAQESAQKISPGAKERIEFLLGIGKVTKDVDVDGTTFTLKALSDVQNQDVLLKIVQGYKNDADALLYSRRLTLTYAITHIDGTSIGIQLGDDSFETKFTVLGQMDSDVIGYIYSHYEEMTVNKRKKYTIKNEKDAEQVVEELKK